MWQHLCVLCELRRNAHADLLVPSRASLFSEHLVLEKSKTFACSRILQARGVLDLRVSWPSAVNLQREKTTQ